MLLTQPVLNGSTPQPRPADSNPDIISFGISFLPPPPSMNDYPPVGPLEEPTLRTTTFTCALPSLAYRREALRSRGCRAPNPVWR